MSARRVHFAIIAFSLAIMLRASIYLIGYSGPERGDVGGGSAPAVSNGKGVAAKADRSNQKGVCLDSKCLESLAEESYERLRSELNQRLSVFYGVPVVSDEKKARLGAWNFSRGREDRPRTPPTSLSMRGATCVVLNDTFLALGMRVPKAASSTLQDLVESLARVNGFAMSKVVQRHSVRHADRAQEELRLVAYLSGLRRRTVHTAHVPFLDFGSLGFARPVYFATVRDPFKRLASHYDYEHFGPRPLYMKLLHQNTRAATFGECLEAHMVKKDGGGRRRGRGRRGLLGEAGGGGGAAEKQSVAKKTGKTGFDCLQTAGLQVRFFCGVSEFCRRTSPQTLSAATRNLERNFAAVVVVEKMLASFKVLEAVLPNLFRGLVSHYVSLSASAASSSLSRKTPSPTSSSPSPPSPSGNSRNSSDGGSSGSDGSSNRSGGSSSSSSSKRGGGEGGGQGPEDRATGLRSRVNEAAKASKGQVTAAQLAFAMADPNLKLEYSLYSFATERLAHQATACNLPRQEDVSWRR